MEYYYDFGYGNSSTFPTEWVVIADVDYSQAYEVDQSRIYWLPATGTLALATAEGCSCWDGEWEVERFGTLDALIDSIRTKDRTYNPSFKRADELKASAEKWIAENA